MAPLLAASLFVAAQAQAITTLDGYAFNIDGVFTSFGSGPGTLGGAPAGVDFSNFAPGSGSTFDTGLGTITITIGGGGNHYVGMFVDHEIDEIINTFFNESGAALGSPAAGQTWEIDDAGFLDIQDNLGNENLANRNTTADVFNTPVTDIGMALAWDFVLGGGEIAVINFIVSTTDPGTGFRLKQTDSDSADVIYFYSTLTQIPEPGTLASLLIGLAGMAFLRRRRAARRS